MDTIEQIAKEAALKLFHPFSNENTLTNTAIITDAINAALTAHDEALPGDWTVEKAGQVGSTALAHLRAADGTILARNYTYEHLAPIAAVHNSAMRPLIDALKELHDNILAETLTCEQDDPKHPRTTATMRLIGAVFRKWLGIIAKTLQPYSTQKDGKS